MTDNNQLDQAKIIGKRIRLKRMEIGLSRSELAEASGVKIGTIERVEIGSRYPGAEHILALCKVLDMSPNLMVLGSESFIDSKEVLKQSYAMAFVFNMLPDDDKSVLYRMMKSLVKSTIPDRDHAAFDKMIDLSVESGMKMENTGTDGLPDVVEDYVKAAEDVMADRP